MNKKHRTVFVLESTDIAGGIKVVLELAARLARIGVSTAVFSLMGKHQKWYQGEVDIHYFRNYDELGKTLIGIKANKIATYWATAPIVASSAQPGEGFYLIQDIESYFYADENRRQLVLKTYDLPLKRLTNSRWVSQQMRSMGYPHTHIGMAIDHSLFRIQSHIPRQPNLVAINAPRTRTLWYLKGMNTLKSALELAKRQFPLLEVHSFSAEPDAMLLANVPRHHQSRPPDSQVAEIYNAASCFLLASKHEGFGLTALEAMACGCPVVCTRADGNEEFCVDGDTCLLVDPGNAQALADSLIRILQDPVISSRIRDGGWKIAQNYQWDRVLETLEACLT